MENTMTNLPASTNLPEASLTRGLPEGFVAGLPEGFKHGLPTSSLPEASKTRRGLPEGFQIVNDPSVLTDKESMIERFGKQLYNTTIAAPAYTLATQSKAGKAALDVATYGNLEADFRRRAETGEPVTKRQVEQYAKPFSIWQVGGLFGSKRPKWAQKAWKDYQAGKLNVVDKLPKETQEERFANALGKAKIRQQDKADISLAVSEASGLKDKAVDVIAGVTGFTLQLAALRKAFPGVPEIGIWEIQNEATGGAVGKGALMYAAFQTPGKLIKGTSMAAKASRLSAEAATLGGVTAIEQKLTTGEINWQDVAIAAGIPVALRSLSVVKAKLRRGDRDVIRALQAKGYDIGSATAVAQPELLSRLVTQRTAASVSKEQLTKVRQLKPLRAKVKAGKEAKIKLLLERAERISRSSRNADAKAKRLKPLLSQIETLDAELTLNTHIAGKTRKNLQTLASKLGISVPREATREEIIRRLSESKLATSRVEKQPALIASKKFTLPGGREVYETPSTALELAMSRLNQASHKIIPIKQAERKAAVEKLRKEQKAGFARELTRTWKTYKQARGEGVSAREAISLAKRGLKKRAAVPEFEPLNLTAKDWNILQEQLQNHYKTRISLVNASEGLNKLQDGFVPTPYEWSLLSPVLGRELTTKLFNATAPAQTWNIWKIKDVIRDSMKVLKLGADLQPFRQTSTISTRHPVITWQARYHSARAFASIISGRRKYINALAQARKHDPSIKLFHSEYKHNYLTGEPWASIEAGTKLQSYGVFPDFLSKLHVQNKLADKILAPLRLTGKFFKAMEETTEFGINIALDLLGHAAEKELLLLKTSTSKYRPRTPEAITKWRAKRGHQHNAFMKRIVARTPEGKAVQNAANELMISPAHFVSPYIASKEAVASVFSPKMWTTPQHVPYATQVVGANLLKMAAIGTLTTYIANKYRRENPFIQPPVDSSNSPDNTGFGKVFVNGTWFDYTGGDAGTYRALARLAVSAAAYAKSKITGEEVTKMGEHRVYTMWDTVSRQFTNRQALYIGTLRTLMTRKDWLGRPIDNLDILTEAIAPTQLAAVIESLQKDGIIDVLASGDIKQFGKDMAQAAAVGVSESVGMNAMSYDIPAYQIREFARDTKAQEMYGTKWDYLTKAEQMQVIQANMQEFQDLDVEVAEQRTTRPINIERLKEEEQRVGDKIRKAVDEKVQDRLKGISVNISRYHGTIRLTDERYKQYKDLVIEELNKQIPTVQLEGLSRNTQRLILKAHVSLSKKRAYHKLVLQLHP